MAHSIVGATLGATLVVAHCTPNAGSETGAHKGRPYKALVRATRPSIG
jgi:hypothetical protein